MKFLRYLIFPIIFIIVISCQKDNIYTDNSAKLLFSTDSVVFDTVFTTLGSTTKNIVVHNQYSTPIMISRIFLAGGKNSMFKLNIDGVACSESRDIEIAGRDSLYIFVKVTVDPQNSNNPLVVQDSIVFELNGNSQDVDLLAWGQDANFIVPDTYRENFPPYNIVAHEGEHITWTNDKPYVIFGYAVVDSTAKLTIEQGTHIYFAKGGGLWIYKGASINVNGIKDEPVLFSGIRREAWYKNVPGQWDRILINEGSVDNIFNYAIIENAFIGIQTETYGTSMGNKLLLSNTIIQNMSAFGILSRFYKIEAGNNLITNCGQMALALTTGGNYDFRSCTFANYYVIATRNTPTLYVSNFYEDSYSGTTYQGDLDKAYFGNCIIYGSIQDELKLDNKSGTNFNYSFDHCLIKTTLNINNSNYLSCFTNEDPLFVSVENNNYLLQLNSPAINKGLSSISVGFPNDLNGTLRDASPDLGSYEYKE